MVGWGGGGGGKKKADQEAWRAMRSRGEQLDPLACGGLDRAAAAGTLSRGRAPAPRLPAEVGPDSFPVNRHKNTHSRTRIAVYARHVAPPECPCPLAFAPPDAGCAAPCSTGMVERLHKGGRHGQPRDRPAHPHGDRPNSVFSRTSYPWPVTADFSWRLPARRDCRGRFSEGRVMPGWKLRRSDQPWRSDGPECRSENPGRFTLTGQGGGRDRQAPGGAGRSTHYKSGRNLLPP